MLELLPYEVLENIAFWLGTQYINGHHYPASSALSPLFLTNSIIHDRLLGAPARGQRTNHALLARLYQMHFDKEAFERRFSIKLTNAHLAVEYKKRICILRRIGRFQFPLESLSQLSFDDLLQSSPFDLWTVLLMIYEDQGRNMRQILHVGVEHWAISIALRSCYGDENHWPIENEVLRISLAIVSLVGTVESVLREDTDKQERLLQICRAFVIAPHRYPMSHFPITSFRPDSSLSMPQEHDSLLTMGPLLDSETSEIEHFGWILNLASPPAAESAFCTMCLRQERREMMFLPNTPEDRAAADVQGRTGATREDYREENYHRRLALGTALPHAGSKQERDNLARLPNPFCGSKRFDIDFWRLYGVHWTRERMSRAILNSWFKTVYLPGILVGKWYGRMQFLFWQDFVDMTRMHPAAPHTADLVSHPIQLFLREHVNTEYGSQFSTGDAASGCGARNAWFPNGIDISRGEGAYESSVGLDLIDPNEPVEAWKKKRYRSFEAGVQLPESSMPPPPERIYGEDSTDEPSHDVAQVPEDVERDFEEECERQRSVGFHPEAPGEMLVEYDPVTEPVSVDVCVTGETGHKYGLAWGAYKAYGRVRQNDGLIMIVRVPGRWIFSGYLRASTTIVGQWRETGSGINSIGYAGPFMLTKVGEGWGPPQL